MLMLYGYSIVGQQLGITIRSSEVNERFFVNSKLIKQMILFFRFTDSFTW